MLIIDVTVWFFEHSQRAEVRERNSLYISVKHTCIAAIVLHWLTAILMSLMAFAERAISQIF